MHPYNVEAPVIIDYVSPLDTHDFSSDRALHVRFNLMLDEVECEIELGERNRFTLKNLEAPSENVAFDCAAQILDKLCIATTVASEIRNPNPHYGHLRLRWEAKGLRFAPRDHAISDSLDSKLTQQVDTGFLSTIAEAVSRGGDIGLMLDAYYRAMGPQDPRTKYAVGFFVVELIEWRCTPRISTTSLLPSALTRPIMDLVKILLKSHGLSGDSIGRVASHIGDLGKATRESRHEKLAAILRDVFMITEARTGTSIVPVDLLLAKRLIDARNDLFHGRVTSDRSAEGYRDLNLILTSIIGQVVETVVEGAVKLD